MLRKFLFMNQVEGFSEEHSPYDSLDLQNSKIENLADPESPQDAANKRYVDSVATGLDVKESCRALLDDRAGWMGAGSLASKILTAAIALIDGVTLAVGDRILVADGTSADNGIYAVTSLAPTVLTRAEDFNSTEEVSAGAFTFITEGDVYADRGFVLVTDDPIALESTPLKFSQFSSTTLYSFDAGLYESNGAVSIELDTSADETSQGADGGSSGLEFSQSGAVGRLRAAVAPDGGLKRAAPPSLSGLAIFIDDEDANPSAQTSLSGLRIVRAPRVDAKYDAAMSESISSGDPVAWAAGANDKLAKGMASVDAKSRIIGVARTSGASVAIVSEGVAEGVLSSATAGDPYYLQGSGGVGPFSSISAGQRVIRVGFAKNASDLFVHIADLGKKAG